jgi:hypothetical protein
VFHYTKEGGARCPDCAESEFLQKIVEILTFIPIFSATDSRNDVAPRPLPNRPDYSRPPLSRARRTQGSSPSAGDLIPVQGLETSRDTHRVYAQR